MSDAALVRIVASHFVAGLEARDGRVVRAAPIIRYMMGWTATRFVEYCERKGWAWERVSGQ